MIVRIGESSAAVEQADDLQRLSVVCDGGPSRAGIVLRNSGLGDIGDGGAAMLDVAALRDLAVATATRPDWPDGWAAMIRYASGKGWVSGDGRIVRAHLEPPAASAPPPPDERERKERT